MRSGWKPFWAALGAALLVLLPLVGGTVLLTRHAARARLQTAESQSGVPIALPKDTDRMTLLVCIADEPPGFVLLYLNAVQNCLDLLTLPAETCVAFGGQDVTLARCYAAAGPARCREALRTPLSLPEDTRYLALSPALLRTLTGRYGSFRVGFSGALTPAEQALCGRTNAIEGLSAAEAEAFLSACRRPSRRNTGRRRAPWSGMRFSARTVSFCPPLCRRLCGRTAPPCSPT